MLVTCEVKSADKPSGQPLRSLSLLRPSSGTMAVLYLPTDYRTLYCVDIRSDRRTRSLEYIFLATGRFDGHISSRACLHKT